MLIKNKNTAFCALVCSALQINGCDWRAQHELGAAETSVRVFGLGVTARYGMRVVNHMVEIIISQLISLYVIYIYTRRILVCSTTIFIDVNYIYCWPRVTY